MRTGALSSWSPSALTPLLLAAIALAVAACGTPGDQFADVDRDAISADDAGMDGSDATDTDRPSTRCIDLDDDGFGINCSAGIDCNDEDPSLTDECYRCLANAPGCPCAPGTAPVSCDLDTDTDHAFEGLCNLGQRNCVNGEWGHCVEVGVHTLSIVQPIAPCPGTCTPGCQSTGVCPTVAADLGSNTGVALGADPAPVFCPPGTPPGGITLPGGATTATGMTRPGCTNLCLQQVTCPGGGSTTVTGTVYAPTPSTFLPPGGMPDPLYNAVVYVPNAPVAPFTTGVTCDQCGAPASGSPLVTAVTGYDGRFTLTDVPVGTNIPLVIQLGRWRRQVVIPNVAPCTTTVLPPDLTRLPRNRSEGDIPLMAMVTGDVDALECVLRKIGIDDSEFTVPTANGGNGRVQMYVANGSDVAGGGAPARSALVGNAARLSNYDLVLLACEGGERRQAAADQQRLIDYANAGGRVFATHYSYVWLDNITPWSNTAVWNVDQSTPRDPILSTIDESFPKGRAMSQWLWLVNASPSPGNIWLNAPRHDFDNIVSPSQNWVYAQRAVGTACSANTQTDRNNCGACGVVCASGQSCIAGACTCPTGLSACGAGCVDTNSDRNNCGACGTRCVTGQTCSAGVCTCPGGTVACAAGCATLANDHDNCGACGNACGAGQACVSGACTCPSGYTACGTSCSATSTDPLHCGNCATACAIGASCVAGACTCRAGYVNCGGECVSIASDHTHCGSSGCGSSCTGSRVCSAGVCTNSSCGGGLTNCSRDCVNRNTDVNNCGSCGTVCAVGASCASGTCTCPAGTTACNGVCVNRLNDQNNCGACGNVCAGGATCVSGACTCPAGTTACNGQCVNRNTDRTNCGACGNVCAGGTTCSAGTCTCPAGQNVCNGQCVNRNTDMFNCGACGTVCPSGSTCSGGTCACPAGQVACNGVCVNRNTDRNNCGACGTICGVGASCTAGACACPAGTSLCNGVCVDRTRDANNCGTCGTACATGATCSASACSCPAGNTVCSGACVNRNTDVNNCGSCGNTCGSGQACVAGTCTCPSGTTNCSGSCVNLLASRYTCGSCSNSCGSGTRCNNGTCSNISSCPAARPDSCSRVCTNFNTDPANCGGCGNLCPYGSTCVGGACSCPAGQSTCSGACVNTATDVNNCGACGRACPAGSTCSGGTCSCPAGRISCNGTCVDPNTDPNNCGACNTRCAGVACSAGLCNPCGAGLSACGAACVNLATDSNNCGACGAVCGTGTSCSNGGCTSVTNYLHYTFNTPVGAAANAQCGRVVFSDFHVNNLGGGSGIRFPNECDNTPMTAQEKILEFMLFDLSSCVLPTGPSGPVCAAGTTACGTLCCNAGQVCQTVGASTQCFTPYPASATYRADVDASASCSAGFAPEWNQLVFVASTPPGTDIHMYFYTAATAAGLATAARIDLGSVPPGSSPIDLRAAIVARGGVSGILPFARVEFVLSSDSTRLLAPILDGYQVRFVCQPSA